MTDAPAPDSAVAETAPPSRLDGWTPAAREAFVAALIDTGSIRAAAAVAGRHFTSAYRLRARDPVFAQAWNAARAAAYARLRDEAMDRVLNGTPEAVWHQGEHVGTRRVHDNRLLMQLLEHLKAEAVTRDDLHFDMAVEDRRLDLVARALDALAAPPPPPEPQSREGPAGARLRPMATAPELRAEARRPGVRVL